MYDYNNLRCFPKNFTHISILNPFHLSFNTCPFSRTFLMSVETVEVWIRTFSANASEAWGQCTASGVKWEAKKTRKKNNSDIL